MAVREPEQLDRPVDLEDYRKRLKTSDSLYVKRLLRGGALTPAPNKRTDDDVPRYVAWRSGLASVAWAAQPWQSSEALLQIAKASHAAEVSESLDDPTDDPTPWETIEQLFRSARDSAPEWKQAREEKKELKPVR